jgi:hypothetical protein
LPRYGLPLTDLAQRAFDAVEAAERSKARTVILRDGQPIGAIVPIDDLDRVDPPDPGLNGGDPLLSLCGTCRQDAFVDMVLSAFGVMPTSVPGSGRR